MLNRVVRNAQAGITMIESVTALLILALGVGGLAWTQARQLAQGRDTSARAMAMLLAHDLGNRMLLNRTAAAQYRLRWGERPSASDCQGRRCSADELARSDLAAWRTAVGQALPAGDATIFPVDGHTRRVGIAIAWPSPDHGHAPDAAPFAITLQDHGVDCPPAHRCHVVHAPY